MRDFFWPQLYHKKIKPIGWLFLTRVSQIWKLLCGVYVKHHATHFGIFWAIQAPRAQCCVGPTRESNVVPKPSSPRLCHTLALPTRLPVDDKYVAGPARNRTVEHIDVLTHWFPTISLWFPMVADPTDFVYFCGFPTDLLWLPHGLQLVPSEFPWVPYGFLLISI